MRPTTPDDGGMPAVSEDVGSCRIRRAATVDHAIHLVGIVAAIVGSVVLLSAVSSARNGILAIGVAVYLIGLFAMLVFSTLYHAAPPSPRKAFLRRLDHAAIFLLIAGTYSPFMVGALDEYAIAAVFLGVWLSAAIGAFIELLAPGRFKWLSIILYLAIGWSGVLVIGPLASRMPVSLIWLIGTGGVLYSVGVVFYLWERLLYQKAIWHGVVLLAAATHYAAVLAYVSG